MNISRDNNVCFVPFYVPPSDEIERRTAEAQVLLFDSHLPVYRFLQWNPGALLKPVDPFQDGPQSIWRPILNPGPSPKRVLRIVEELPPYSPGALPEIQWLRQQGVRAEQVAAPPVLIQKLPELVSTGSPSSAFAFENLAGGDSIDTLLSAAKSAPLKIFRLQRSLFSDLEKEEAVYDFPAWDPAFLCEQVLPFGALLSAGWTAPKTAVYVLARSAPALWESWQSSPLKGARIVVTRALLQAEELISQLLALGALPVPVPTIQTVPPRENRSIDEAIHNLHRYDWIVFSSANGVVHFFRRLSALGADLRILGKIKMATVGAATASKLAEFGFKSDLVPPRFVAESLLQAFSGLLKQGERILILRPQEARATLREGLQQAGLYVDEAVAYRTVGVPVHPAAWLADLAGRGADWLIFTSPSTVRHFAALFPGGVPEPLLQTPAVCIGPVTRRAAETAGFSRLFVPDRFSSEGIVQLLLRETAKRQPAAAAVRR